MDQGESAPATAPPAEFQALRALIVSRRPALPRRLAQVADFAVAQPQEVALRTATELAAEAGVPASALVRFAQTLGYSGFSELQAVFRAHARTRWPDYGERLRALGTDATTAPRAADLLAGFLRASEASLHGAAASIDPTALEQAVALLAAADTIYLLASRRAFPVAFYLAYAMRRLDLRCQLVDQTAALGPEQMAGARPGDAALVTSFTPYAPTSVELAAGAARRGVPVLAITDSPFSPLIQAARVWLEVAEANHLGFRSLAATLALATTLAVATARRRQDERGVPN